MKIEKVEKLKVKLHDKKEYAIHIRNLKQVLDHGLELKKVQSHYIQSRSLAKIIH